MFTSVLQFCKKEKLIEHGDVVLAGVSGGADSVCLLLLLKEMQRELDFSLEAVHVEHGIRGEESKSDAAFVERLCEELNVPLYMHEVQAMEYATVKKIGLEEAARELRYDCYLQDAKKKAGTAVKVALAHHADDNAETMLFQMIRGSGIDGLGGMRPKRVQEPGIEIIRPLLKTTRTQIEGFLESRKQSYCTDSTNTEVIYSRNKMRHEVLPKLSEINTQAVLHMNQSASLLQELGDYLQEQVAEALKSVRKEAEEGCILSEMELGRLPNIIQKEVLHQAISEVAGSAKDIGSVHVELLQDLFALQVGRKISLPYGISAKRIYEGVTLKKNPQITEKNAGDNMANGVSDDMSNNAVSDVTDGVVNDVANIRVADSVEIGEALLAEQLQQGGYRIEIPGGEISFSLIQVQEKTPEISKKRYTKCFDYDKMIGSFQIRTRQSGDYLVVDDVGHRKRLKEYFINEKIPSEERDKILLLTQESKVIWVIGGRISADVKVSEYTKRILKVQITGGNYHEG